MANPRTELPPTSPAPSSALVTFETLEKFTGSGLTDRSFRLIADKGFFPKPVDGQYNLILTNRGYIKYCREMSESLKSTTQANEAQKLRKSTRENDIAEKVLVLKSNVLAQLSQDHETIKKTLDALEKELPLAIAGMDVATARIVCSRWRDRIEQDYLQLVERWKI